LRSCAVPHDDSAGLSQQQCLDDPGAASKKTWRRPLQDEMAKGITGSRKAGAAQQISST
jgi:hypothetical protein